MDGLKSQRLGAEFHGEGLQRSCLNFLRGVDEELQVSSHSFPPALFPGPCLPSNAPVVLSVCFHELLCLTVHAAVLSACLPAGDSSDEESSPVLNRFTRKFAS